VVDASLKSFEKFFIWLHEFFHKGKVLARLPGISTEGMKSFWPKGSLKERLAVGPKVETMNIFIVSSSKATRERLDLIEFVDKVGFKAMG